MQPRLALSIFFAPYFWVGLLFAQTVSESPLGEAETLLNGGKSAQAVVTLEQYLRLHPHDALGHWILGRALYWSGKPEAARLGYRCAIDLDPANAWKRVEFGWVLAETGDMDRAREVASPAHGFGGAVPDGEALPRNPFVLGRGWDTSTFFLEASGTRTYLLDYLPAGLTG